MEGHLEIFRGVLKYTEHLPSLFIAERRSGDNERSVGVTSRRRALAQDPSAHRHEQDQQNLIGRGLRFNSSEIPKKTYRNL